MKKKIKEKLDKLEIEDDLSKIPLLDSLYIYFDDTHHSSGYNYIIVVGKAYQNTRYEKIIARYSDVVNISSLFSSERFGDKGQWALPILNFDYKDGEMHLWSNRHLLKIEGNLSDFELTIVKGKD